VATDFYSTVNLRFCRGFCGKCVFRCGAFVVELWWNVWQNVVEKRAFLRGEKWDTCFRFIFADGDLRTGLSRLVLGAALINLSKRATT
jgi:hypothetical protein